MTTSTTNTTVANTSTATFDAWVTEIIAGFLACGLTQTADTGQMANPCTTAIPGTITTVAGYYVFSFNDALQATAPVFIKMEFGTGSSTTIPYCLITVGTGSNGAGTITGTVMTRVACYCGSAPQSTVTNYNSYFCYNATQGFLGLCFKDLAAIAGTHCSLIGFWLFRSIGPSGAPNGNSLHLLTNSGTATTGSTGSAGAVQVLSYKFNTVWSNTGPINNNNQYAGVPFTSTATQVGTQAQVFPLWQFDGTTSNPGYGITNAVALGIAAEAAQGTTATMQLVGGTSLTYIVCGACYGGSSIMSGAWTLSTYNFWMIWQ